MLLSSHFVRGSFSLYHMIEIEDLRIWLARTSTLLLKAMSFDPFSNVLFGEIRWACSYCMLMVTPVLNFLTHSLLLRRRNEARDYIVTYLCAMGTLKKLASSKLQTTHSIALGTDFPRRPTETCFTKLSGLQRAAFLHRPPGRLLYRIACSFWNCEIHYFG